MRPAIPRRYAEAAATQQQQQQQLRRYTVPRPPNHPPAPMQQHSSLEEEKEAWNDRAMAAFWAHAEELDETRDPEQQSL